MEFMMFEQREVITLLLAAGVLAFIVIHRETLKSVPNWPVLFASFLFLFTSLACSVVEGMYWETLIDSIQHLCSGSSGVAMAIWCKLTFVTREPTT
jgi:hypothetical protein